VSDAARDKNLRAKILLNFATIYLVWGSTFLAIRIGVRELPSFLFASCRFLLAGSLLCAIGALLRERFPRTAREWRYVLLFSFLMVTFSNGGTAWALRHLPSNETALLSAGSALWIAWFGSYGPRGHRLTPISITGLALGLVGVVLLVWPQDARPSGDFKWQAVVLLASVSWATGTVLFRNAALPMGPLAFNATMMLFGGTWMMLIGLARGEAEQWHASVPGFLAIAYLAVFGSALAYPAYAWLLKHAPADRVGTFAYVNPAIATVLGWALLGEQLSNAQIAGTLIVLSAVALVTLPAQKPRSDGRISGST
jgi:drug/metabolite transporter (DMT)-like permease